MREFIERRDVLILLDEARGANLNRLATNTQMGIALNQLYDVSTAASSIVSDLSGYLDDMEKTSNLIFDGIEAKIRYIEQYCDLIASSSTEIPEDSVGSIHIFDLAKTIKTGTAYAVGIGIILETN